MRDFKHFQDFCSANKNKYEYLAYKGAFERIEDYQEYQRNGHYMQLFYAIYDFYTTNRLLISRARVPAFDISNDTQFYDEWSDFISDSRNDADGFSTDSLRKNLSPACAGQRRGGGGWSPIAKIMFSSVAAYILA